MTFGRCVSVVALGLLLVLLLPSCSQTANVTEVWMALDSDGSRRRNEFFTDTKEIHCVSKAGIGREGVTVEAFIRSIQLYDFGTNRFEPLDAIVAYAEFKADRSQQPATFDLELTARDPRKGEGASSDEDVPFFPGRYQCEILLDGELEGTAIFNIGFPPCPPAFIVPGSECFGFYRENDLCPAYGASAAPEPKCSCTLQGWQC
jgi:hypothetical protein